MENEEDSSLHLKSMDEINRPMDVDDGERDHSQGVDECGMYGITPCSPTVDMSLERLGICPRQEPAHISYATLDSRLESFSSWPLHIKLRPEALSDAGFYYTGKGDKTVCFQCNGGLKDWEENDDPWKEHARYFPKCTFLIQKMGRDFISEVLGKSNVKVSASPSEETEAEHAEMDQENSIPATTSFEENTLGNTCSVSDVGSSGYSSCGSNLGEESSCSQDPKAKKLDDQRACKICYAEEMGVVFLPCGHLVSCVNCAPSLKACAVCRKPFSATVRAYLS